jgi:hypothetical protein
MDGATGRLHPAYGREPRYGAGMEGATGRLQLVGAGRLACRTRERLERPWSRGRLA